MTRKTAVAAAAMSVASLVSATFALASTMDLPILGLGSNQHEVTTTGSTDSANEVSSTTSAPVQPTIVEQVVYDDVYQRVARPTAAQAAPAPVPPTQPAPTQPALVTTTTTAPPPTTVPTTTSAPTTAAPTTTRAVTTTRPAPPPGCLEPEWDRELQRWHCKGN